MIIVKSGETTEKQHSYILDIVGQTEKFGQRDLGILKGAYVEIYPKEIIYKDRGERMFRTVLFISRENSEEKKTLPMFNHKGLFR